MRPILSACAAAAALALASCASTMETFGENLGEAPVTPMTVAEWRAAPQGPFRAAAGDRIVTQVLTSARVVTLVDAPSANEASAGDRLFAVTDARGIVRFCDGAEADELACFEDADGDGAFDLAWTAAAHPDFPLAVRRWTGSRALATPLRFTEASPLDGPQQQIAIRYLGRSQERYGFALQVGGPDGFSDVAWTSHAAWLSPDSNGVLEFAGARVRILDTPRDGVVYELESPMTGGALVLQVSTATRTLGDLVAVRSPAA